MAEITIDAFQFAPDTSFTGTTCELRLWYAQSFIDSTGVPVSRGTATTGFRITVDCTIVSGVVHVPSFVVWSTLDAISQSPQSIQINAVFYNSRGSSTGISPFNQIDTPASWVVPNPTPLTTMTFEQWTIYNATTVLANAPQTFWTAAQTQAYFDSLDPAPDASDVTKGITKLSVAPAVAINPIAVGDNDPRLTNLPIHDASASVKGVTKLTVNPASATSPIAYGSNDTHQPSTSAPVYWLDQFTSLTVALSTIGSATATLMVSTDYGIGNASIPATLTLAFTGAGALNRSLGTTVNIAGPIVAPLGKQIFNGSGTTTFTSNISIAQYSIDWFGVIAGSNDTVACQAAATAFPANAYIRLVPGRTYATEVLTPKRGQTWDWTGATLAVRTNTAGGVNSLFDLTTNVPAGFTVPTTSTTLTTAIAGATAITVGSTASFLAGDRIVLSAGTFTGSGTEQGPIEFATVASVSDGTHLVITEPLAYNISGFGLAGAANKKVYRLGVDTAILKNVTFVNGTITRSNAFGGPIFNVQWTEGITINGVLIGDLGTALIATVDYVTHFALISNRGVGTGGGNLLNGASMVYSIIANNTFNFASGNNLLMEVTCHDNAIINNTLGPIRSTPTTAAIGFTVYGFNNRIAGNRIWGLSTDITAGVSTLGIRTYESGTPANTGHLIIGNEITNIMAAIGDIGTSSIIDGNFIHNDVAAGGGNSSTAIITTVSTAQVGMNSMTGMDRTIYATDLTTPAPYTVTLGTSVMNGVPAFLQGRANLTSRTNLIYISQAASNYGGFVFQGQSASDMFFGRAATGDDLIVSTGNTGSPAEVARFGQAGTTTFAGNVITKSVRGTAVAFASLPSGVEGMIVAITDSNTNTWGANIAGGGVNHVLGYFNGSAWTCIGK